MTELSFALYDAFTDKPFAGSQAAVVSNTSQLSFGIRKKLAEEIAMPATVFIDAIGDDWLEVQFLSTVMELPMCGHGTICLMTHLVESKIMTIQPNQTRTVELRLPKDKAVVELSLNDTNRVLVMLDVSPARFEAAPNNPEQLAALLGITTADFDQTLPLEVARGDFIHLIIPLNGLNAIGKVTPDFSGIVAFCHQYDLETVVVFSQECENPNSTIRVRDFCPAVGVPESAAAGTTNAALSNYLLRNQILDHQINGKIEVIAEQGCEINRPSEIRSIMTLQDSLVTRLQVGGVATKVLQGLLTI